MKNITLILLLSIQSLFAQTKVDYNLFIGKSPKVLYTQVANNQIFCSYAGNESSSDIDSLWQVFYPIESQKYSGTDSLKLLPIHKFSLEDGQNQFTFLKYSVVGKGKPVQFILKTFILKNKIWENFEPKSRSEINLAFLFKNIKTDIFQKLFAREDAPILSKINALKKKVLNEEGFVNYDELVRQLKSIQTTDSSTFNLFCDKF